MSNDKDNELLQLIYQHLHEKFPEISEQLRVAACIDNQKIFLHKNLKQNILDGHWSQIIDDFKGLNETNNVNVIIFKILTQKLNEKLFEGDQKEALEILRNEISPLGMFPERMHNLAQNILLSRPDPLGLDRLKLAQDIITDLKNFPGFLFTENRLDELVGQAKKYQIMNCPYHYDEREEFSVWQDHKCARSSSLKLEIYKDALLTEDAELLKILCNPDKTKIIVTDEVTNQYRLIYNFESDIPNWTQDSIIESGKEAITVWPQICELIPRFEETEFYFEDIYTGSKVKCQVDLGEIIAVAFFTKFRWAVVSTKEQITSLIDCENGKVIHSWIRLRCQFLLTPQNNQNIDRRDEDEKYKYFLGVKDDGSVVQISCLTYEILKTLPTINEKFQISSAYLESGRLLIGYTNSTIFYYEDWWNYGQPTRIFRGHTCEHYRINVILSEFERNLVIGCSENGSIYVWNIESGRLIYEIPLHDEKCVNDVLEIEPKTFLSCGDDQRLYQWKLP